MRPEGGKRITMEQTTRLVVVSNRLPISLKRSEDSDDLSVLPGSGGLVTAMAPILRNRGGKWIGWSGTFGESEEDIERIQGVLDDYSEDAGYSLHSVPLTREEMRGYYYGFANEIVWPLFHDFQSRAVFDPDYWRSYLDVNFKFAEVVASSTTPDDYVWVHDYHLMHQALFLRSMGVRRKCGFFLHIPFPSPDIFMKLPWRWKIIQALLEFDLVGFHTIRDRRNFAQCLHTLMPEVRVRGRGAVVTAHVGEREVRIGAFPISIDYNQFANLAGSDDVIETAFRLRQALKHRKLILGVDRLDYTKGIPERMKAIDLTLRRYPDLKGRINFIQVVVPSREEVEEYKELKLEIEQLVGRINGEHSVPGWVPIQYLYRNLPREELAAYYSAADMALVTPLRDGMNLVAKEYCACNVSESGVLILSEFAGAAGQLQRWAYMVNPHDLEGVARAIRRTFYWDNTERTVRMRRLRDSVRRSNIYWWVDSFLLAAFSKNLGDFPPLDTVRYSK